MATSTPHAFAARPRRGGTRSVVWAPRGIVAAAHPLAAQAGVDALKRGGTAVDAAIAANACLGVMEPTACGLGGDLFAIVWDPASRALHGLNGSGRAPLALTPERVPPEEDGTIPLFSPYSWTVPGCAAGWFDLHARFGRLPMPEVLAAAISYAAEGFPLSPVIAAEWERGADAFAKAPGFAEVFLPAGRAPRVGERFRNQALARTLAALARDGRDAFYRGALAAALVRFSGENGGFLAGEDLARHASTWDAPITTSYRGYEVWELPPNGQGLAALQMLNVLEGFDVAALGRHSADFWHLLVEAKKLAFADRARHYADPAFAEVPVAALLSKEYAKRRATLVRMDRAALADDPGDPRLARGDTTYLAAADASGMMVSLIQSNYTGFGSGYAVPELGFGLQDRGGQFSLSPGHPNRLAPGKRPFHTIMPGFVTRGGEPLLAFGVMGADMQPQGHAQVLVNLIDLGLDLQEAGDVARFRHSGSSEPTGTIMRDGGVLYLEPGVPAEIASELARRGHRVEVAVGGAFGGYQAVARDPETGMYAGASEPRKDGCAIGY